MTLINQNIRTENAGFGFDKMDTKWMGYNHTQPVYDLSFDSTIVMFRLEYSEETSEKTLDNFGKISESIRNELRKSPVEKVSEILIVSGRTTETYFSALKDNGMIDRVGSRKEGYWKVKQNMNKT